MSDIMEIMINFMKITPFIFEWNGTTYTLTIWQLFVGTIVAYIGIYVIREIRGD